MERNRGLRLVGAALSAAIVVSVVVAGLALAQPGSKSGTSPCPFDTIQGNLGNETVVAAANISCGRATEVVRAHDQDVDPEVANTDGGRFRLGNFRCQVRRVFYESARAKCRDGERVFRIDYGY